jgi:hypothetical protein
VVWAVGAAPAKIFASRYGGSSLDADPGSTFDAGSQPELRK